MDEWPRWIGESDQLAEIPAMSLQPEGRVSTAGVAGNDASIVQLQCEEARVQTVRRFEPGELARLPRVSIEEDHPAIVHVLGKGVHDAWWQTDRHHRAISPEHRRGGGALRSSASCDRDSLIHPHLHDCAKARRWLEERELPTMPDEIRRVLFP